MKRHTQHLRAKALLTLGVAVGLSGFTAYQGAPTILADDVPQTVNVAPNADYVTFAHGRAEHTKVGTHAVTVIKEAGTGNYLFCVQWSKKAPSAQQIQAKVEANPAVEWLVNNYYSGNRYESLGQGDLGDYWLYQSVIHWTADPNDHKNWGGTNGAIQDHLNDLNPTVRRKVESLHNKALSVSSREESQIPTGSGSLNFNPGDKVEINKDEKTPVDGFYQGKVRLNSSAVHNTRVWLEGQSDGVTVEGADLNNVGDGADLNIKIPADKLDANANFKIKANGVWDKSSKVVWIYGDHANNRQDVAHMTYATTEVPLDTEVTITAAPRKYFNLKLDKKDYDDKALPGAQFVLVRRDANGSDNVQITPEQAKKEAYRLVDGKLVRGHNDQNPYVSTSGSDGAVHFNNVLREDLNSHDYYAVEVKAPNGYTLSNNSVKFPNINVNSPALVTQELKNSTIPLPRTGSNRLLVVGIVGLSLLALVGVIVYHLKPKNNQD